MILLVFKMYILNDYILVPILLCLSNIPIEYLIQCCKMLPLSCSPVCFSPAPSSTLALSLPIRSTGDGGGVFENVDTRSSNRNKTLTIFQSTV